MEESSVVGYGLYDGAGTDCNGEMAQFRSTAYHQAGAIPGESNDAITSPHQYPHSRFSLQQDIEKTQHYNRRLVFENHLKGKLLNLHCSEQQFYF